MLKKEKFVNYTLQEDRNPDLDIVFSTRLNNTCKDWFLPAKRFLKQPKNSTALKQLAEIGAIVVLQDPKMSKIINIILNNSRKNERIGVSESDFNIANYNKSKTEFNGSVTQTD